LPKSYRRPAALILIKSRLVQFMNAQLIAKTGEAQTFAGASVGSAIYAEAKAGGRCTKEAVHRVVVTMLPADTVAVWVLYPLVRGQRPGARNRDLV